MDIQSEKCVMIVDGRLPLGVIANTAAILGITLGRHLPDAVGPDVLDGSGHRHLGIIAFPVPILQGTPETLRAIREKCCQPEFEELTAVDFSELAQGCRTYDEFIGKMGRTGEEALQYMGVALCGPKRKVNRLTGCLPLLR